MAAFVSSNPDTPLTISAYVSLTVYSDLFTWWVFLFYTNGCYYYTLLT
jgi:hypothetical protein